MYGDDKRWTTWLAVIASLVVIMVFILIEARTQPREMTVDTEIADPSGDERSGEERVKIFAGVSNEKLTKDINKWLSQKMPATITRVLQSVTGTSNITTITIFYVVP